jgi:hypothetical protein
LVQSACGSSGNRGDHGGSITTTATNLTTVIEGYTMGSLSMTGYAVGLDLEFAGTD